MKSIDRKRWPALGFLLSLLCLVIPAGARPQGRPRVAGRQQSDEQRSTGRAGQEPAQEDVVRVNTRIVVIDALVKEKRTGASVTGLTRDDFQVLDDGRPREVTYFSAGDGRRGRPLALLLAVDPWAGGPGKHLRRPEVLQSLIAALDKLPPEDEVGLFIVADARVWPWPNNTDLTSDRAKLFAALKSLPDAVAQPPWAEKRFEDSTPIEDVALSAASSRPNSQVAVVMVTDSIHALFTNNVAKQKPDEIAAKLNRANASLSSLVTGTNDFFMWMYPVFKTGELLGELKVYGVPQFFARQTGGDVVQVRKPEEYGAGLERLIGSLTARYSLGFTLGDDEAKDGRLHRLEVRVKARDARGKERRLTVSARRGYYAPDVAGGGARVR